MTCFSGPKRRPARRATGSIRNQARPGSPSCACMARSSRGSTRRGVRARSNRSSDRDRRRVTSALRTRAEIESAIRRKIAPMRAIVNTSGKGLASGPSPPHATAVEVWAEIHGARAGANTAQKACAAASVAKGGKPTSIANAILIAVASIVDFRRTVRLAVHFAMRQSGRFEMRSNANIDRMSVRGSR